MALKMNGNDKVKVGMRVDYRQNFGHGPYREAVIETIEICDEEHEKYGEPVDEVSPEELGKCAITLSDGRWCYGYQIDEVFGMAGES